MGGGGLNQRKRGKEPRLIAGGYVGNPRAKWPLVTPYSGVAGRKFIGTMVAFFREPRFKGPIFNRPHRAARAGRHGQGGNFHLKGKPVRKTGGVLGPNGWISAASHSSVSSPAD